MQKTTNDQVTKKEFGVEEKQFLGGTNYRWIRLDTVSYKNYNLTPEFREQLEERGFVECRKGVNTTWFCMPTKN